MKKQYYPLLSFIAIAVILFGTPLHTSAQVNFKKAKSSLNCNHAPIIHCPPNFNACPGSSIDPIVSLFATAEPGSPECATPIVAYVDNLIQTGNCPGAKLVQRVWTATDPDDPFLRSFCIQYLSTLDTLQPVFINCPRDTTILSNSKCKSQFSWIMPLVTDVCGNFTVTTSHPNGSDFTIGHHQITITAIDVCGNSSSCSFHLEVISNCCTAPKIDCPRDFISCPGTSLEPTTTGRATAVKSSPNCKNPLVNFIDRTIHSTACSTEIERTWIAIDPDDATLFSSCKQTIKLQDLISPVFVICPSNITVQSEDDCTATVTWQNAFATDNCGPVTIASSVPSGSIFTVGVTLITIVATDVCGNTSKCEFSVIVEENCCNKPPIITCPSDFTGCPGTSLDPSITGRATASPATSHCKEPKLRFSDTYIESRDCETIIQRTWKATDPDKSNLFSTCIQIIKLEDKNPPVITHCPPNVTVQSGNDCTAIVNWNPPVATDNCAHVNFTTSKPSGSTFQLGQTTVIVIATDNCGNSASCSFHVTVTENCCQHPPILTCPSDFTTCPSSSIAPATTGTATALPRDVHCGQPLISFKDTTIKNINCLLEIHRTWTATDPQNSSLTSSCIQKIILKDDVPPIITSCPLNVTVLTNDNCIAIVNWNEPTATDNCGTPVVTSSLPSGTIFLIGVSAVVITATDACGNSSTCNFNITVRENCCNNPPVILCPGDYRACPGSSIDTSITGKVIADPFNLICQQPTISFTDNIISTDVCRTIIHRVWKAVNPKNNAQTICTQIIILEDVDIPVFVFCPPDVTIDPQYNCNTTVNWSLPIINDNCGIKLIHSSNQPGETFTKGITRVVYTATDNCGNTASCWFFITVTDKCCDKNPLLHCPPDYTSCPGQGINPSVTGKATAEPGKVDCLNPIVSYSDRVISTGICPGVIKLERTWIAVDPNINSLRSECKQIIDIKDIEPPRIQNMPADLTVNARGSCDVPVFWIHAIAVDNCGLGGLSFNYKPGTRFTEGKTTVIYTAVDLCGLVTKDSFDITVIRTEIGVICPDDTTVIRTDPFLNGAFVDWTTPKAKHCKPCKDNIPGFIYMGELDGHRYFCSTGPANWGSAKSISEQLGGRMAIINSEKENKFLASKLNGLTAWLGATDEVREGRFVWLDDKPLTFTSWLPGQPNDANGDEDYIELLPDGSWNDQIGTVNREYIIEIPCYELTQIGGAQQGDLLPCGINKITYAVQKDGKSDTCSFNITVDCDKESVYCKAKALNSTYMYINRVQFAGIDTITGDNGGYKYFNHACGSINAGQTYPICVSPGFLTSTYKVYWKIWIDFNADGFFDPVTEEVVYGFGTTTMCATLTMPFSLPKKQTRMRVIMSYTGYPASPCTSPLYGEVEDYCILMNGASEFVPENDPMPFAFNPVQLHCVGDCEENEKQILDNGNSNELNIRKQDRTSFEVDLFPNPSSNKVFAISKNEDLADYEIYNTHGKMILKSVDQKAGSEFNFSVVDWPNGIYTIIINNNVGQQLTKRFMVNH